MRGECHDRKLFAMTDVASTVSSYERINKAEDGQGNISPNFNQYCVIFNQYCVISFVLARKTVGEKI